MSEGTDKRLMESSNIALTAVALQDHWSRSINLGTKFGPRKIGLGPAARAKQKVEVKSVIDTGRNRGKNKCEQKDKEKEKDKEYVLDKKPPPLTLAQKFGIIHAPKPLLSETEWTDVKEKSNKREDSEEPCVICKEDFGLQEQVLLSCTHVFHRACLQAFERFTGRKTCPMCRHESYQTRVIHEGARLHRHKCATRIQATWRGHVVYMWYKNLRETVPPKDPMLRKKFYEEKLSSIVDRMVKSLDMNMAAFLRELDDSIKQSREVFDKWDACHTSITAEEWEEIQLKAVERGIENCPICLTELCLAGDADSASDATGQIKDASTNIICRQQTNDMKQPCKSVSKSNVEQHRKKADKKLFEKLNLFPGGKNSVPDHGNPRHQQAAKNGIESHRQAAGDNPKLNAKSSHQNKIRSTVLLSCTHVFHTTCLSTLEEMAMVDMRNSCPVCRAHYQKKVIVF